MTVYENEALRVEFLEVGKIAAPNLDVPLRFKIENRGTVRIAGTLDIGGPTRGILPRNEPTKRFEVEKGSSIDLELQISFGENCVDGFYPVHAFFLFEEGRGDRAILTRLIRPDFAAKNRSATEDHRISVASFRPAAVENVVDRFFEEKRLAVMADYARSLDSGTGRAYRLSSEEGAYHLLFAPGRQGMLDGRNRLVEFPRDGGQRGQVKIDADGNKDRQHPEQGDQLDPLGAGEGIAGGGNHRRGMGPAGKGCKALRWTGTHAALTVAACLNQPLKVRVFSRPLNG